MGALNPLFLLAGLAAAVPIYLHLFQRHRTRRVAFPALRYLERTEREHAREIRFRQILLMLARVLVLLLVVGSGARLFLDTRGGSSHPPTAAVLILDNSLSSSRVVGDVRVVDRLKAMAERTLDRASVDDRFWVIRAGEPWLPAIPGTVAQARIAVSETTSSDAAGDLTAALTRARRLLATSELRDREIHLFSDLQATAFREDEPAPAGDIPVVVWSEPMAAAANMALDGILIGSGLPPLEGERSTVTVSSMSVDAPDTARVAVRLIVNERIRGAGSLPVGAESTIPLPPAGPGWILGYADADPDDLRADDRRFFAFRSRPAPTVVLGGSPGLFVREAVEVLRQAERLRMGSSGDADVLISDNGIGLDQQSAEEAALILPPSDATLLPALNRRLAARGIPWLVAPSPASGEIDLVGASLPPMLERTRIRERYSLSLSAEPPGPPSVLAEAGGQPWAVEGTDMQDRRYLLLGSPMTREASSLPVSTAMLRFVDWVANEWAGSGGGISAPETGSHLPAPAGATLVRVPSGEERPIDATRTVRETGQSGFYTFLADDSIVSVVAVNPPTSESLLRPLESRELIAAIGNDVTLVDRESAWAGSIYRARRGAELWWPLLLGAVVLLMAESLMATSGARGERGPKVREGASRPMAHAE